jgi:hypothetical protein
MKQIPLNRLFLIGLSAYLRRVELSVDRALRQDIGPLKDYCQGAAVPTLRQVLGRLGSIGEADDKDEQKQENAWPINDGPLALLFAWLGWYLRGRVFFQNSELRAIHASLLDLSNELEKHRTVDPDAFAPIRLRLRQIGDACIARIPDRGVRRKIYSVEHLNQNPNLKTETIDSICDHRDWLS